MNGIRELTEMEAEAVSGGRHHPSLVDLHNVGDVTVQNNIAVPTVVAVSAGGEAFGGIFNGGQLNKTHS